MFIFLILFQLCWLTRSQLQVLALFDEVAFDLEKSNGTGKIRIKIVFQAAVFLSFFFRMYSYWLCMSFRFSISRACFISIYFRICF